MMRLSPPVRTAFPSLALAIAVFAPGVLWASMRAGVSAPDAERPSLGSPDAPVTIVQFTDYQCRFCKRFFEERLPELKSRFVESGQVRFVVRDFPLKRHPRARPAAVAAACAAQQEAYWPMHALLYENQAALEEADLRRYAGELELDEDAFERCMGDPAIGARIDADIEAAKEALVSGTPAFLIGNVADGRIHGTLIVGFQPLSVLAAEIAEYSETESPE